MLGPLEPNTRMYVLYMYPSSLINKKKNTETAIQVQISPSS